MKIVHYINNLGSGGAEKLLSDILPLIKKKGMEVELMIANSDASVEKYTKIVESHNIKITSFKVSFYNPIQVFSLVRYVTKNKIDMIHAHLFPTQYWLAIASFFFNSKVKLIKTEHSVFNERKNYKFLRPLERFIYRRYDKIIAITEEVRSNLSDWLGKEDVVTIPNGVNIEQIKNEQADIDEKQYEFLLKNHFNILMVGRFDGFAKDQQTLVKALALLPSHFRLYFAGEGHFMKEIKTLCHQQGLAEKVTFLGMRQDVYKLMHLVDLNVLSTNHEGLSGVVLESLASEQAFLGSNVVGVKEIVPDKRFLFSKGNYEELAEKIKNIADNSQYKKEMVLTAMAYVQRFDISYMVDDYVKVYRSLRD